MAARIAKALIPDLLPHHIYAQIMVQSAFLALSRNGKPFCVRF